MNTIKIVYNSCFGECGLSPEDINLYNTKRKINNLHTIECDVEIKNRHDELLVEVVEELGIEDSAMRAAKLLFKAGKSANGQCANLKIKELPSCYEDEYYITEYDGFGIFDSAMRAAWLLFKAGTSYF